MRVPFANERSEWHDGRTQAPSARPRSLSRMVRRSDGEPCRGQSLSQGKSDRCSGRSPGSWVIARCTPSQTLPPSGCSSEKSGSQCIALATYSCRDSRGFGRNARQHLLNLTDFILGRLRLPLVYPQQQRFFLNGCHDVPVNVSDGFVLR